MSIWITNNIKILYFGRIDVYEWIEVNKKSGMWYIYDYWAFLNYSFKFQPNVSKTCHDI